MTTRPGDPESDFMTVINRQPKVIGGMTHSFSYKNISVSLSFDYKIQYGTPAYTTLDIAGTINNIPVEIFNNRWQKPGDHAKFARFSSTTSAPFNNKISSIATNGFTDASFFRFRTISVNFQLPESFLQKIKMKNASIGINTNNLFVITKYEGIDPEVQHFGGMPPLKTVMASLSLSF